MKYFKKSLIFVWLIVLSSVLSLNVSAASLNKKKVTLEVGQTYQLKLNKAKSKKVTWKSNNKKICSISKKGKLKAKKTGKTTVYAKYRGKKYKCKIVVKPKKTTSGSGKIDTSVSELVENATVSAEEQIVLNKLLAFKSKYPNGRGFTNKVYYSWRGGIWKGGYGCAAFAFELSDGAFGTKLAYTFKNIDRARVGDIVWLNNCTHLVIVLRKDPEGILVAEANVGKKVRWGSYYTRKSIIKADYLVISRW